MASNTGRSKGACPFTSTYCACADIIVMFNFKHTALDKLRFRYLVVKELVRNNKQENYYNSLN